MYYKIPLGTDLSNTSFQFCAETDEYCYIGYNDGFLSENWVVTPSETVELLFPESFCEEIQEELSQLDRIEIAIEKSHAELRQEGADALTEELIESGVL